MLSRSLWPHLCSSPLWRPVAVAGPGPAFPPPSHWPSSKVVKNRDLFSPFWSFHVKINFIHRFEILSRRTCERNFNKDAFLRLLRLVNNILEVHDVGCTQLTLSCCLVSITMLNLTAESRPVEYSWRHWNWWCRHWWDFHDSCETNPPVWTLTNL